MIGTSACWAACSRAALRAGSFTRLMAFLASFSSVRTSRRPSTALRPCAGKSGCGATLPAPWHAAHCDSSAFGESFTPAASPWQVEQVGPFLLPVSRSW